VARPAEWSREGIFTAFCVYRRDQGHWPSQETLTSLTRPPGVVLPSLRTVQKHWRWAELRTLLQEIEAAWVALIRDPWSGSPVAFYDFADVGYFLPLTFLAAWYRQWLDSRPEDSSDAEAFWGWSVRCELADVVPTFPGGLLCDLPPAREQQIRDLRRDDRGLMPPRVIQIRTRDGDWRPIEYVEPTGYLSLSAKRRIRARLDAIKTPKDPFMRHLRAIVAEGMRERERSRQQIKCERHDFGIARPEWTDRTDTTRWCMGDCDDTADYGISEVLGTDGLWHEVPTVYARRGTCPVCGGRYPGVCPSRFAWQAPSVTRILVSERG
jgi:hypothetical protein